MSFYKHFSKENSFKAKLERICLNDCLSMMIEHIEKGNFELAKQRSIDVTRSLHELSKLAERRIKQ